VVNSDELLTRRQLRNQGVQVIRYRQHRYDDRSLTISSKAPLNLLDVMVGRRLQSLNADHTGLIALVSEAKYIMSSVLAHSRRVSAVQLRETVNRVREALFGDPGRLDRD
jgi:hypothetical protein